MILSLAIALSIYLPLLLVIATVGVEEGQSIAALAEEDPEGIVANAARNYLGHLDFGWSSSPQCCRCFRRCMPTCSQLPRIARAMARGPHASEPIE